MRTLIVTAHADPLSRTRCAADRLHTLLGEEVTAVAHLTDEGFDPRFTPADLDAYRGRGALAPDVVTEQRRMDDVTDLVLVFPVYWWSMPALLKGWVDRVFVAGWAFDVDDGGRIVPRLQRLRAHLVPVSGTTAGSFARHGYTQSFDTQVLSGIVDYCGMRRGVTAFVHDSETTDQAAADRAVEDAVSAVAAAITAGPARPSTR
ncbi:NAD(P)H-dependent oxidoreductase [Modestobacter sp. VKM Ac-2986]|uniref:NAD(P)H-dependent oxidoreductase n=1 Tax=Modestobacter sp. VKM Ac-2986 TaxID=3004140 RepID=UPI0022AB4BF3|nr:NAD(P)H-dependent oxidoreductase [Modestobacter sp. VKM Ac-2986]MCZ2828098.1 NAD(P)H-dependent oxidoreductase [Modestobacter sp. VKM Ac-2986]